MNLRIKNILLDKGRRFGMPLYIVGGPVRDMLLNRNCEDWDFVSRHAEKLARAVSRALRGRLIILDEENRIYRVLTGNIKLDFAELQGKTIENDLSRRDFTVNAMALRLTDLPQEPLPPRWGKAGMGVTTATAIPPPSPSPTRGEGMKDKIFDPFHGQRDIKKGMIRAVTPGCFKSDPLRLVRAFRFAAQFNWTIEARTRRIIARQGSEISRVARERVREEMLRLLSQPRAGKALLEMDSCGLLTRIFPELEAARRVGLTYYGRGGVVKHVLQTVENLEWLIERIADTHENPRLDFVSDKTVQESVRGYLSMPVGGFPRPAILKLGALLHDVGKPAAAEVIHRRLRFFGHEHVGAGLARKMTAQLRFSRQESALVGLWVQNHMRLGNLAAAPRLTDKAIAHYLRDLGGDTAGMLLISLADHYTYLAKAKRGKGVDPVEIACRRLLESYYLRREKVLPPKIIDGHILMKKLRLKPGPLIGRLLEAVQDAQSESRIHSISEALAFVRKKLRQQP
jgi:putative nucleotidyltransferase with HDIG domain